ncbi:hypothetical protein [Actinoplanes sp. NPDC089786]|uniref:hypothetical protein n=1 Tax=Actinoplanes sp. NPDC089786 TaxID=3155185 RepID=UPI0034171E40
MVNRYAKLWDQSDGEAVDTLIRLHAEPVHLVAAPLADSGTNGNDSRQAQQ